MARPAEPDRKPPRFPWVQAVFCAACVGMATWTWMAYSFAWDAHAEAGKRDPGYFGRAMRRERRPWSFVRVRGNVVREMEQHGHHIALVRDGEGHTVAAWVTRQLAERLEKGDETCLTGRLTSYGFGTITFEMLHERGVPIVKAGAPRLTGASVAGLVVGAMGLFVFSVALRHWLGERRRSRERDERA